MDFALYLIDLSLINVILTVSLNLILGQAGLLSVSHGAFMAFGAYATALLTRNGFLPWWLSALIGIVFTGIVAAALARISLQFRGFLYVIISFSFMLITTSVLNNWVDFTGGPYGIFGILPPKFFGVTFKGYGANMLLEGAVLVVVLLLLWRLWASPFGLALRATRENEEAAQASGLDVTRLRITAFVIGTMIASLAGSLYAPLISFIEPTVFNVFFSFTLITMLIVGGTGSLQGAAVGAFALTLLPFAITFLPVPQAALGPLRQVVYGVALIVTLRWRPQGLIPERPWRRILPALERSVERPVGASQAAGEVRP